MFRPVAAPPRGSKIACLLCKEAASLNKVHNRISTSLPLSSFSSNQLTSLVTRLLRPTSVAETTCGGYNSPCSYMSHSRITCSGREVILGIERMPSIGTILIADLRCSAAKYPSDKNDVHPEELNRRMKVPAFHLPISQNPKSSTLCKNCTPCRHVLSTPALDKWCLGVHRHYLHYVSVVK